MYFVNSCDNMSATHSNDIGANMISFKGRHFQQEMRLQCVRWYLAYSLSYRNIEELMKEQGFEVDHSTVHDAPKLKHTFQSKKNRVGDCWRLDETYIKVKGQWK
jgi:putative transposase